ncbi:hypothetical protein SAMN05428954_2615 [Streptomyces sp. 2112.3]|nr:hypothetical protein SAMN05428954_2615 [Streptomyces sp. 2112.3]
MRRSAYGLVVRRNAYGLAVRRIAFGLAVRPGVQMPHEVPGCRKRDLRKGIGHRGSVGIA